jgi:hypothetical protein
MSIDGKMEIRGKRVNENINIKKNNPESRSIGKYWAKIDIDVKDNR